jgi:hypothetical protein
MRASVGRPRNRKERRDAAEPDRGASASSPFAGDKDCREPSPYLGSLGLFAQIGDDWALFNMIEYLIERAEDPRLHTQFGPTEASHDVPDGFASA